MDYYVHSCEEGHFILTGDCNNFMFVHLVCDLVNIISRHILNTKHFSMPGENRVEVSMSDSKTGRTKILRYKL